MGLKKRLIVLKKRLIYNIKRPEMRILPGQLAFFIFIALIPLIALIGGVIAKFELPYDSISNLLNEYFPNGTANLLQTISTEVNLNFNVVIFFFSAIILASNGTHSMIIASNQIYKIKDSGYFKRRIKAFFMIIIVFILFIFVILIPVFGDMIFDFISGVTLRNTLLFIYKMIKYPLSFTLIYFLIKLLYIMAPDKKIKRSNVVYGSLFTSFSWVILTQVYSIYIESFTNYVTFYGGIANILILMLWLYLLSYIFVLGMALNATKYGFDENVEIKYILKR